MESVLENDNPPPTGHSLNRRRTSELLSADRRKNGAKIKKKLSFDKPDSFSLPLLHEHIFGIKPRSSHGAEVDVNALIRVCASQADAVVNFSQKNYAILKDVKKMW